MRQVGKTTLLKQLGTSYVTLDDDDVLRRFEQGIWTEIESAPAPLVVDEAQKSPGLFDRVKLIVDRRKRPGQFLLTGSVRFLSRKQIRESLTGRTSILELLPLTAAETHSRPLTDFIKEATRFPPETVLKKCAMRRRFPRKGIEDYVSLGGMPGVCFKRDPLVRRKMQESHLETLLMRDLQFLVKTRIPFVKLRAILSTLAQIQGQSLSLSDLGRKVQLSTPTIIQLILAFENLFIVRPHGKSWFFADCGMASFLGAALNENALFHMERFVYQELYAQWNYLHASSFRFHPYLTRGGVRIPFVIDVQDSPTLAVVVDATDGASEKSLKSLTWFAKKHKKPVVSVVLHRGSKAYLASTSAICLPYDWIV
jgi:predicted AAA+ superfamily ATPase